MGSCRVAASVVAVCVGGRGARGAVGVGPWWRGRFCCRRCRPFCDCWGCVWWCCRCWCCFWLWWWWGLVLLAVLLLALGFLLRFAIRLWFGEWFKVEQDIFPKVWGDWCRAGGLPSLLPRCWSRPCGGRGGSGSLVCGCCFGFGRGLVDEVGREG